MTLKSGSRKGLGNSKSKRRYHKPKEDFLKKKIEKQSQDLHVKINHAFTGFQKFKMNPSLNENEVKLMTEIENMLNGSKVLLGNISTIVTDAKRLDEVANYLTSRIDELEAQLDQFSELAGLGLTAEALSHEMSNIIDRLVEQTSSINQELNKTKITNPNIFIYLEYVNSIIKSLRKQLSHLAPLLHYARETKEQINVIVFANEIRSFILKGLKT